MCIFRRLRSGSSKPIKILSLNAIEASQIGFATPMSIDSRKSRRNAEISTASPVGPMRLPSWRSQPVGRDGWVSQLIGTGPRLSNAQPGLAIGEPILPIIVNELNRSRRAAEECSISHHA